MAISNREIESRMAELNENIKNGTLTANDLLNLRMLGICDSHCLNSRDCDGIHCLPKPRNSNNNHENIN